MYRRLHLSSPFRSRVAFDCAADFRATPDPCFPDAAFLGASPVCWDWCRETGGTLPRSPHDKGSGTGPHFLLWAARDPEGANLDRLQIIKGWVDANGQSHEAIFDVALSDGRDAGREGGIEPVGNTVDVASASYGNSIGAGQLQAFWSDPAFDPEQEAFYYARAIEIPTPRWSTYDAQKLGVEAPQPTSIQERAISSAIWYPGTRDASSPGN